jgi:hypothetical protein
MGWAISREETYILSPAEVAAFDAPFTEEYYKAGARVLPKLVASQMAKVLIYRVTSTPTLRRYSFYVNLYLKYVAKP